MIEYNALTIQGLNRRKVLGERVFTRYLGLFLAADVFHLQPLRY